MLREVDNPLVRQDKPENKQDAKEIGRGKGKGDGNDRNGNKQGMILNEKGDNTSDNRNITSKSISDDTIYKPAVEFETIDKQSDIIREKNIYIDDGTNNIDGDIGEKRLSSSSEEAVNTSDEMVIGENLLFEKDKECNLFPGDNKRTGPSNKRISDKNRREQYHSRQQQPRIENNPRPSTSSVKTPGEIRAEEMIRQAETAEARIYDVPGESVRQYDNEPELNKDRLHSVIVDEEFSMVASHLDDLFKKRIEAGEYVDFARLIPKEKLLIYDDNRMEMVNRDGRTFFVPAADKETISICNFARWEQAFRIYSNIYTAKYPGKAVELIQYNHIIHSASMTFSWDNVYAYDRDFRHHISKFPDRSWGIILQQAWSLRLRDRLTNGREWTGNDNDKGKKLRRDVCWKFNKGRCSYGFSCKFEHRCALCFKFGHGSHNCRRGSQGAQGQRYNERSHQNDRETGESWWYTKSEPRKDKHHKRDRDDQKKDKH